MMNHYHIIVALLFTSVTISAQIDRFKVGKISPEAFNIEYAHLDSTAAAVVVHKESVQSIYLNVVQSEFIIKQRIKIINKDGFDWGDFNIKVYKDGNISKVEGYTYELVNGEIQKSKLEKKNIIFSKDSETQQSYKWSMPNIKEGVIIDVQYTETVPSIFQIPTFYFQNSIPVLYSRYEIEYPEIFDFHVTQKGYHPIRLLKDEIGLKQYSGGDLKMRYKVFEAKNIPPFESEPYMTTAKNFLTSIAFEINSISPPNDVRKDFTETWESINRLFLEQTDFGDQLKRRNAVKGFVDQLDKSKTRLECMVDAYNLIRSEIHWNNRNGVLAYKGIKNAIDEGQGNAADINLSLVLLLRELGFDADPVILSTRNHGIIFPGRPTLASFNYTICHVLENEKSYFLDATEENLDCGVLPIRCFNGRGRLIHKTKGDWIDIIPQENKKKVVSFKLKIDDNSQLKGQAKEFAHGYDAFELRNEIDAFKSNEAYIEDWKTSQDKLKVEDMKIEGLKDDAKVTCSYEFNTEDYIEVVDDLILITPFLKESTTKNPFKLEQRTYPVDFGVPVMEVINTKIEIPEGKSVESLPENAVVTLPDGAAKFIYAVVQNGNSLSLTSNLRINKILYTSEEYLNLKEFFNLIVKKHEEPVVLIGK